MSITITDDDRREATAALVDGYNKCPRRQGLFSGEPGPPCLCDIGAIAGCREQVEAVAASIAAARKM